MNNSLLIQALYALVNSEPVKVMRDEKAKDYPLIAIKKDGDVGYDLHCTEDMVIKPGKRRTISTGIYLEMPEHLWATIEGRSSASKWDIEDLKSADAWKASNANNIGGEADIPKFLVVTGIIDTGYRGELKAVVVNIGPVPVTVSAGERYAQVLFHLRCTPKIVETDKLAPSERGDTGFGSSGK